MGRPWCPPWRQAPPCCPPSYDTARSCCTSRVKADGIEDTEDFTTLRINQTGFGRLVDRDLLASLGDQRVLAAFACAVRQHHVGAGHAATPSGWCSEWMIERWPRSMTRRLLCGIVWKPP